jgi:hypothetical protein
MNYNLFRGLLADRPMLQCGHGKECGGEKGLPLQGPGSSLKFLKHHDVLPPTGASRTEESRQANKSAMENKVKRRNIVDGTSCSATQALILGRGHYGREPW